VFRYTWSYNLFRDAVSYVTFSRSIPSNHQMRSAVASLMSILVVVLIAACALSSCAIAADAPHSCCHKHSMPNTEMKECAYNLLERSKVAPAAHFAATPLAQLPSKPEFHSESAALPQRLADSTELYLRIRVLLI